MNFFTWKTLFILYTTFSIALSYSFVFLHGCSHNYYLKFQYSYDMASLLTATVSTYYIGASIDIKVSYSTVYYKILDENNTLLVSSILTMNTENINAISYVLDPSDACQHSQYSPTDTSLNTQSVVIFINAAQVGKSAYIGTNYQGYVPPTPGSFLQITSPTVLNYKEQYAKFCNTSCSSTSSGYVKIPLGSALFCMNYIYNISIPMSYVTVEGTGSTSVSWCANDDCLFGDDDFGLGTGAIVGIVIGSIVGCCILCGCGYLIYRFRCCCGKKKDPENPSSNLKDNAANNL